MGFRKIRRIEVFYIVAFSIIGAKKGEIKMTDEIRHPVGYAKELVENKGQIPPTEEKPEEVVSAEIVEEAEQMDRPEIREANLDDLTIFDISDVATLIPVVLNIKCKHKDSPEMLDIGLPGFINKASGIFLTLEGNVISAEGFDYHLAKLFKDGRI